MRRLLLLTGMFSCSVATPKILTGQAREHQRRCFRQPGRPVVRRAGRLWIQTDVSGSVANRGDYQRLGNNQMLVADVASGEIRRFLTGPKACEITGISATPDARSLFINVQHPGEAAGGRSSPSAPLAGSGWPANQFAGVTGGRPRSATLVIRRADGGVVGT
jgi:secreted PhoX family phosphatase